MDPDRYVELSRRALALRAAYVASGSPSHPPPLVQKADVLAYLDRLEQRRSHRRAAPPARPAGPSPLEAAAAALRVARAVSPADVASLTRSDLPFPRCLAYLDTLHAASDDTGAPSPAAA